MSFERRILHHGPDPDGTPVLLSLQAVRRCWFDLHRQGGCGAAELVLSSGFDLRDQVEVGDWISFESEPEERWYLGRVEERRAESPAEMRLRLEGMGIELNEVFPGGFGLPADGRRPHRYAQTDLFPFDPDYEDETFDLVSGAEAVVHLLMSQYVAPFSHITYEASLVEAPVQPASLTSLKVRGEESVRGLIKDLALRARSASWGVDAGGRFFFLRPRDDLLATFREGEDLTALREIRDREHLFNRILLTGDYVYDRREQSDWIARRSFRWRGNYVEPNSREQHGNRRIRIWLPWIRTQADSVAFAREFFRVYAQPTSRYFVETAPTLSLPHPWLGRVRLEDREGNALITARVETMRVLFDHAPQFRMELGPDDPRNLWPEPPHDERWELPDQVQSMGDVSLTDSSSSNGGGSDSSSGSESSSSEGPAESSSGPSSAASSASSGTHGSEGSEGSEGSAASSDWSGSTGSGSEFFSDGSGPSGDLSSGADPSSVQSSSDLPSGFPSSSEPPTGSSEPTGSELPTSSEEPPLSSGPSSDEGKGSSGGSSHVSTGEGGSSSEAPPSSSGPPTSDASGSDLSSGAVSDAPSSAGRSSELTSDDLSDAVSSEDPSSDDPSGALSSGDLSLDPSSEVPSSADPLSDGPTSDFSSEDGSAGGDISGSSDFESDGGSEPSFHSE